MTGWRATAGEQGMALSAPCVCSIRWETMAGVRKEVNYWVARHRR